MLWNTEYQAFIPENNTGYERIFDVCVATRIIREPKFYDRDVFLAFEKHGHWGLDIYLIAHNFKKVTPEIVNLIEFETRIVPRTFQFPDFFSSLEKQDYDVVGRGRTPKKQEIFRLYKSQHFEQGDKVSKPFLKYFAFAVCLTLIGFYFFIQE